MKTLIEGIIILVFFALFMNCHKYTNSQEIPSCELPQEIISVIEKYCESENCNECYNELFIDRITADSTVMTLRSQHFIGDLYKPISSPSYVCNVKEKKIFIYTGAEQYIKSDKKGDVINKNTSLKKCSESIWTIIHSFEKYKTIYHGSEPFMYPQNFSQDSIKFFR